MPMPDASTAVFPVHRWELNEEPGATTTAADSGSGEGEAGGDGGVAEQGLDRPEELLAVRVQAVKGAGAHQILQLPFVDDAGVEAFLTKLRECDALVG